MASREIRKAMSQVIIEAGASSLMLAGGITPQAIYREWSMQPDFPHDRIKYYFGDERCVPPDHTESNFGSACRSLFPRGVPNHVRIRPMAGENPDHEAAARHYERLLPEHVDVLILGLGEDGHIASLFPGNPAVTEMTRSVVPVVGPQPPKQRLSITPKVIANARKVFLLATGSKKGKVLARAMKKPEAVVDLPVRLALSATWLLDQAAASELPPSIHKLNEHA